PFESRAYLISTGRPASMQARAQAFRMSQRADHSDEKRTAKELSYHRSIRNVWIAPGVRLVIRDHLRWLTFKFLASPMLLEYAPSHSLREVGLLCATGCRHGRRKNSRSVPL